MEKDKKAGGAVRKTDEAKAPEVSPSVDEVPGGAAVVEKASEVDPKKAKKAVSDKVYKDKKKQEKLDAEAAEIEAAAKRGHFIAEGKCISCKKGILEAGNRVKPEYFGVDGETVFNRLIDSGAIVEVK